MSDRYIYVIGDGQSRHKIGISWRPTARCGALMAGLNKQLFVHFSAPINPDDAYGIERLAHWQLKHHSLGHEWFCVSTEAAIENVESAIVAYRAGSRAPLADSVTVSILIPTSTAHFIDEWRRKQAKIPSRSEAIRHLVDEALRK